MKKIILIVGEPNDEANFAIEELKKEYSVQVAKTPTHATNLIKILGPALLVGLTEWMNLETIDAYREVFFGDPDQNIPAVIMGHQEDRGPVCAVMEKEMELIELPFDWGKTRYILNNYLGTPEPEPAPQAPAGGAGAPAGAAAAAGAAPTPMAGKRTILIIDDNASLLRIMKSVLESRYRVLIAPSGEKGLQLMQSNLPAMVFLDYEMPGMSGKDVLASIRQDEILSQIPVVFLTAVNDKQKIMEIMALKPEGYMLKPATPDKIFATIESLIG
jgi:CheY-like chemotaxis protein